MVCVCGALDLPETRTVLDGAAIAEAGARAQVLWPWEPEPAFDEEEPTVADLPEESWFARALRAARSSEPDGGAPPQPGLYR